MEVIEANFQTFSNSQDEAITQRQKQEEPTIPVRPTLRGLKERLYNPEMVACVLAMPESLATFDAEAAYRIASNAPFKGMSELSDE